MEENVPEQAAEPIPAPEKTKKKSPILTIIFAILALAGIGFGVYGMCFNKPAEKECVESEAAEKDEPGEATSNSDNEEKDVKAVLKEIAKSLADEYGLVSTKTYDEEKPITVMTNPNIITDYGKSYGLNYNNITHIGREELEEYTRNTFIELGFEEEEQLAYTAYTTTFFSPQYINDQSDIVCKFGTIHGQTTIGLEIGCAHKKWQKTGDELNLIRNLAAAYKEATGNDAVYMVADDVVKSEYEQYEIIYADLGNAVAFYYRENPDADWKYSFGTQSAMTCSNLSELETQIFKGKINCYHDGEDRARELQEQKSPQGDFLI